MLVIMFQIINWRQGLSGGASIQTFEPILEQLKSILNMCFETEKIPDIFKTGLIRTLYKSGERENISNYRFACFLTRVK